jgi:hypothetical protein
MAQQIQATLSLIFQPTAPIAIQPTRDGSPPNTGNMMQNPSPSIQEITTREMPGTTVHNAI